MRALRASYGEIGSPGRLLLGLSGGADSVALLHLLSALARESGCALICVHVHHGLRAAADAEADFVVALCREMGIPLMVKRVTVSEQGSVEAAAREARYRAFSQAMQEADCRVIALAHHADDQAETLMLHLMHGSGPGGMAGMSKFSQGIWRPLLAVRRDDLRAYLEANHLSWREDESNADTDHLRNAIRHKLMPIMREMSPAAVGSLGRTAAILRDEEDYWEDLSSSWLWRHAAFGPPCSFLLIAPWLDLHPAARRRILRAWCLKNGVALDYRQTLRLQALAEQPSRTIGNLPGQARALLTNGRLYLLKAGPAARLPLGKLVDAWDAAADAPMASFDAGRCAGALLRYRRSGDRISPLGAGGSQKLREYMIDHKIDQPLRDSWPLLCRGDEVLWVIGVGMGQTAAIGEDTREIKGLRYLGKLPGELQGNDGGG
ncbi:MAG: tRNA lysidine(34) synthetase TilS [Christensenellales bacterium]